MATVMQIGETGRDRSDFCRCFETGAAVFLHDDGIIAHSTCRNISRGGLQRKCQGSFQGSFNEAHSTSFLHPAHDPGPIFLKRPSSHEQAQVIARRDLVAKRPGLGSYQPLRGKQLLRGDHVVGAPGKKIDRKPQPREVDLLP